MISLNLLNLALKKNIPLNAIIELTHRCNLRCGHCYISDYSDNGELTKNEWKRVLRELESEGCLYLLFTGGEVLLKKDFLEIAEYSRECGFAITIFTNGLLVNKEVAKKIGELAPLSVGISIYGAKSETHEKITGLTGSFEKSIKSAILLLGEGVKVRLKTPIMNLNFEEREDIIKLAEKIGAGFNIDPVMTPKNDGSFEPLQFMVEDEKMEVIFREERERRRKLELMSKESGVKGEKPFLCDAGRAMVGISPDGDVYPCIQLLLKAGNLRESSFYEIWGNSETMKMIRGLNLEDHPDCVACSLRKYCTRCPGIAMLEKGDILSSSEISCRVAKTIERIVVKSEEQKFKG